MRFCTLLYDSETLLEENYKNLRLNVGVVTSAQLIGFPTGGAGHECYKATSD